MFFFFLFLIFALCVSPFSRLFFIINVIVVIVYISNFLSCDFSLSSLSSVHCSLSLYACFHFPQFLFIPFYMSFLSFLSFTDVLFNILNSPPFPIPFPYLPLFLFTSIFQPFLCSCSINFTRHPFSPKFPVCQRSPPSPLSLPLSHFSSRTLSHTHFPCSADKQGIGAQGQSTAGPLYSELWHSHKFTSHYKNTRTFFSCLLR